MLSIRSEIEAQKDFMVSFRRELHRHPELGWQEEETTRKILEELDKLKGLEILRPAKTGLIAVLHGEKPDAGGSHVIGLRADMDALQITEETGLPYASGRPGVMHACGHDLHTTSLLTALKLLYRHRAEWSGTVKCIFQPSEEYAPSGAAAMMAKGDLDDCEAILGIHVKSDLPVGRISVESGPRMAASGNIRILVRGKGGHAGMPADAVDASVAAAAVLLNLQTIASRELSLDNPAVITIGTFHSGTAPNIISGEAELKGTYRYYSRDAQRQIEEAVARIAKSTAAAFRAEAEVEAVYSGCDAVINDPTLSALAAASVRGLYGEAALSHYPISGLNEDFSIYASICPQLYILIGAENREKYPSFPLHSPHFCPDEDCMEYAVGTLVQTTLNFLAS